jgi:hypothetical protein
MYEGMKAFSMKSYCEMKNLDQIINDYIRFGGLRYSVFEVHRHKDLHELDLGLECSKSDTINIIEKDDRLKIDNVYNTRRANNPPIKHQIVSENYQGQNPKPYTLYG